MTEPGQASEQPPEEAVTFADEQQVEPASDASGPQDASDAPDDVGEHRVNEGL